MSAFRQLQKSSSLISRRVSSSPSITTLDGRARPCLSTSSVVLPNDGVENAVPQPTNAAVRPFSSFSVSSSRPSIRAFPQYNVHGVTCMLSVKLITPSFKISGARQDTLSMEQNKRGRILFEFTPRGSEGTYVWGDQIRFGLSPEEVGLLCSQLPQNSVELSRSPSLYEHPMSPDDPQSYATSHTPDKVLKAEPGQAATVNFSIDYVKDGIGGQEPAAGQEGKAGPLELTVQAGEYQVIASIMKESIPYLVGWTNLVQVQVQRSVDEALKGGGGGSAGGNVPF